MAQCTFLLHHKARIIPFFLCQCILKASHEILSEKQCVGTVDPGVFVAIWIHARHQVYVPVLQDVAVLDGVLRELPNEEGSGGGADPAEKTCTRKSYDKSFMLYHLFICSAQ